MARPRNTAGKVYPREGSAFWWVTYRARDGHTIRESSETTDREEAERFLRERLAARDPFEQESHVRRVGRLVFGKSSKPPYRSEKTHQQNMNAVKLLRPIFGATPLSELTPEAVEDYIETRLTEGRRIHTKFGLIRRGKIKPATVHQEFRVLRHMLNVAIRQKKLEVNPCAMVEFPVSIKNSTRKPHYMTSSEQVRIEFVAPSYLRHVVVIMTEIGPRPYRELLPMLKSQVDLENRLVHISGSKTDNGIGDMPMTEPAYAAFKEQMDQTPGSEYLFPRLLSAAASHISAALRSMEHCVAARQGSALLTLRATSHLRDKAQCGWSSRPLRPVDASTGRC